MGKRVTWSSYLFDRSVVFVFVCAVIAVSFCVSLYPGAMTWDSSSVLTYLLDAEFKQAHSPGLQYVWYLLLPFSKSQALIFILNNLLYWSAVALFSVALARFRFWIGWFPILTALLPYTIYLSHVVAFDVASNVFLLLFFAVCFNFRQRQGSPTLFILALLCLLAFLMSRYNAITALLPMALFLSCFYKKNSTVKQILRRTILIVFVSVLINQLSIVLLVGERPDYIGRFTARFDLLAMSAEQDHQGITRDFPENLKKRITQTYQRDGWFLNLYEGDNGIQNTPVARKKVYGITKGAWIREIIENPVIYLKMRFKTSSRMFTRQTQHYSQSPLFIWKYFENRISTPILDPYFESGRLKRDSILRSDTDLNPIASFYGSALSHYMALFPGTWAVPLIGIGLLSVCFILYRKGIWSDSFTTVFFMNVTAIAWYFPLLILVHLPLARYIFPSDSLILFSVPVFILACLEIARHPGTDKD